jgi:predicted AAA+ superfamily ATPase
MASLDRFQLAELVEQRFRGAPIVALLGPRQSGKTTLARRIAATEREVAIFDLEDPRALARLEHPLAALEPLRGLVVIDEVQRRPELFEVLRVLADREGELARFLILGSASPQLVAGVSESLAGRVSFVDVTGFDLQEVGAENFERLWIRGGFPRSYLADDEAQSAQWRDDFVRSFLERDVPQLGISIPAATLRRFWTMVAHWHAQVWNSAEFARSFGVSDPTVRRYLDLLTGTYVVRQLPPWFENVSKRQVKSPKVYVRDSGLLHSLLGLGDKASVESHPKLGASWEGFALEQVIKATGSRDLYFWATHGGAELDVLWIRGAKRFGLELKYGDAPRTSRSMHLAIEDLALERLFVVHPGRESHVLTDRIEALSILDLHRRLRALALA